MSFQCKFQINIIHNFTLFHLHLHFIFIIKFIQIFIKNLFAISPKISEKHFVDFIKSNFNSNFEFYYYLYFSMIF